MNKVSAAAAAAGLLFGGIAMAFDNLDQFNDIQNGGGQGWAYLDSGFQASQTFKQTAGNISGASIYLGSNWGDGNVTLSVYTTDPYLDGGANPVAGASGTVYGTHGNWADIFWSPVSITAGQTYFLNFRGDGHEVIDYSFGDTYTNGDSYWYGGPAAQNYYDYSFKTWSAVPAPGSAALLGLGGLVASRRRRA